MIKNLQDSSPNITAQNLRKMSIFFTFVENILKREKLNKNS